MAEDGGCLIRNSPTHVLFNYSGTEDSQSKKRERLGPPLAAIQPLAGRQLFPQTRTQGARGRICATLMQRGTAVTHSLRSDELGGPHPREARPFRQGRRGSFLPPVF